MVTVPVAAYSGGVLLRRIPARPPAVTPAAVCNTRRRLTGAYSVERGSFVCIPVPYNQSKSYCLYSGVESQYRTKAPPPVSPRERSERALALRFGRIDALQFGLGPGGRLIQRFLARGVVGKHIRDDPLSARLLRLAV